MKTKVDYKDQEMVMVCDKQGKIVNVTGSIKVESSTGNIWKVCLDHDVTQNNCYFLRN